jgi:hypothetical protein
MYSVHTSPKKPQAMNVLLSGPDQSNPMMPLRRAVLREYTSDTVRISGHIRSYKRFFNGCTAIINSGSFVYIYNLLGQQTWRDQLNHSIHTLLCGKVSFRPNNSRNTMLIHSQSRT